MTDAITQNGYATQTAVNSLSRQLADCCCENRAAIAQVRYDMASQNCELGHRIDGVGERIASEINAIRMETKNERIAELQQQLFAANLAASQSAQNAYLVNQLRPCPSPAYIVPNPFCCDTTTTTTATA